MGRPKLFRPRLSHAYGDSGAEVFRLFSLGMQNRVSSISKRAADMVWDRKKIDETVENMDKDDYVESGLGGAFTAGFDSKVGADGGQSEHSAEVGTRLEAGTKLTAEEGFFGGKRKGNITFERVSTIDFGANPRATVYVLLENISKILNIPLGG